MLYSGLVMDFFLVFFVFVLAVNFPVVWVVLLGFCLGGLVLYSLLVTSFGVSALGAFYLFVGGIMCVCGFFCCFFWSWNFKLVFFPSLFLMWFFSSLVEESFKFKGSCFVETLFGWSFFECELLLGVSCLFACLMIILVFVSEGVGCVRGWEV